MLCFLFIQLTIEMAQVSPHTTTKAVRDCASCHSNSATLGYGNGTLAYEIKNKKGHGFLLQNMP